MELLGFREATPLYHLEGCNREAFFVSPLERRSRLDLGACKRHVKSMDLSEQVLSVPKTYYYATIRRKSHNVQQEYTHSNLCDMAYKHMRLHSSSVHMQQCSMSSVSAHAMLMHESPMSICITYAWLGGVDVWADGF